MNDIVIRTMKTIQIAEEAGGFRRFINQYQELIGIKCLAPRVSLR